MSNSESQRMTKEQVLTMLKSLTPATRMVVLNVAKEMKAEQRQESANRNQSPK